MSESVIRAARGQLSPEERLRHSRFLFDRDKRDFAVAHTLLRRCLSARGGRAPLEWAFAADPRGKPMLAKQDALDTPLAFNLSHTAGLVACAVGEDVEVGIDVERIDRDIDAVDLASRFFSSSESGAVRRLEGIEQRTRFAELWTLKEAFIKAIGEGLSCPLDAFSFTFGSSGSLEFDWRRSTSATMWLFALFAPSPDHRMAVAIGTRGSLPELRVVNDARNASTCDGLLKPLRSCIVATHGAQRGP
jgi:4'-phosphopantetheinyl transferase